MMILAFWESYYEDDEDDDDDDEDLKLMIFNC